MLMLVIVYRIRSHDDEIVSFLHGPQSLDVEAGGPRREFNKSERSAVLDLRGKICLNGSLYTSGS